MFLVSDDAAGSGYHFIGSPFTHGWVRVEGDGLPVPVDICVGSAPDGRSVFTGLRIGGESAREAEEITSNTLRQIKLSEILAAYFEYSQSVLEMERSIADASVPLPPGYWQHVAPARGPDHEALKSFARAYLTELARQPQRAMTAAAKAHNISRATANRWAALCREFGYLPRVAK